MKKPHKEPMKNRKQPPIVIPENIPFPALHTAVAGSGVRLHTLFVEGQVARVSFVFRAGTALQSIPFSASAASNLIGEGSLSMSSKEMADKLDFYGSYFSVSIDRDWSVVTFCCLSKFFPQTMEIARQMLLFPAFSNDEVATYCAKRKQSLLIERSKASFRARELLASSLFGPEHPYGVSSDAALYDRLTRDDIVAFYNSFYLSDNCFVVSSGNIGDTERDIISQIVDGLPSGSFTDPGAVPVTEQVRYGFARQPGAVQSALRMGLRLFPRYHPDFIPMQVVATTLGGYFSSRLVRNLREERGYTYGAYAAMVNLQHDGYLAIATEVASQVTDDAIKQVFIEIERLCNDKVGDEELRTVKNIMAGEVMRIIDGPFGVADVAIEDIQNGEDNDYVSRLLERVKAFTSTELLDTAQKYLAADDFTVVAVGASKPKIF